jgi:hypothetical protein
MSQALNEKRNVGFHNRKTKIKAITIPNIFENTTNSNNTKYKTAKTRNTIFLFSVFTSASHSVDPVFAFESEHFKIKVLIFKMIRL